MSLSHFLILTTTAITMTQLLAVDIVAHRGASYDAPENTMTAFQEAWKQGADAIEGDFHLTQDGHIVCIHDKDTQKTGGQKRLVSESTLSELRSLEYGAWKSPRYANEPIPLLTQVIETIPENKYCLIEIKCGPEIIEPMANVIRQSEIDLSQLRVISFNAEVIRAFKRQFPDIKAFWLTSFEESEGRITPSIDQIIDTLKEIKADGLDCKADAFIDADFVSRLRKENYEFHIWTVDDATIAQRFADLGVDSITTNRPAWLRAKLSE